MAAFMRLALGVLLCTQDILMTNIMELKISNNARKGDIITKCGCSNQECLIKPSSNSDNGFEISNSGNIILSKDAELLRGLTYPVSVLTKNNCYDNMFEEQNYVFHIVDSTYSASSHLFHSSIMLGFPAFLGTVSSFDLSQSSKDQIQSFQLSGPLSDHFKIEVKRNEVYLVKEQSFLMGESSKTFLFVLEVKGKYHSQYNNIEVYIGDDLEGSEYFQVIQLQQESHSVVKRQSSTAIPKSFSVYENTTGTLFNVLDNQPPNSGLSFEITGALPQNIFQIDAEGNVTLGDGFSLDYDRGHRSFNISIEVKGVQGGQVSNYLVNLVVLDSNDESPTFLNQPHPFQSTVRSNMPTGTVVYSLSASDPDTGSNLRFYINGSVGFAVDENTGNITTTRLFNGPNDTNGNDYVINAYVSDIAAPILQTTVAMVTIRLGLRGPQFFSQSYTANIRDDNDINQIFPILDQNGEPSSVKSLNFQADLNGNTTYSVYSGVTTISDKFAISADGQLRVLKKLLLGADAPVYTLFIQAQDSFSGLSTKVNLTVNLLKNYKPMLTLPVYTATVPENLKINDTILTVETIASDNMQQFNYSVDSPVFWVQNLNGKGIIRVNRHLDYEAVSDAFYQDHSYTFHVTVDGYNMTSLVIVYLQNVNDEVPVFTSSTESTIQDTIDYGRIVMNVKAIDKDGDGVTYRFLDPSTIFAIDRNSGQITITRPGNQIPADVDSYKLTVIAKDDGSCCNGGTSSIHSETQEITINIVDSKNYKPQFAECSSYYNASILEEEPVGTYVLTVSATDINKGENGVVDYTILSFRDDLTQDFTIQTVNKTGVIRSNVKFDRETLNDILKVTVIATDHGQPPLSSECSFIVNVVDINDNSPAFLSGENVDGCNRRDEGVVSRDSSKGNVALNIRAFDVDSGDNAQIDYSILDSPGNYFDITSNTGMIFVNQSLSDAPERVTLHVLASDKGDPPNNSTAYVDIVIKNSTVTKLWPSDKNNPNSFINDNTRTDALITTVSFGNVLTGAKLIVKCQSSDQANKFKIEISANNRDIILHAAGDFDDEKDTKVAQIRVYTGQGDSQYYEDSYFLFSINDTNNKIPRFVNRENPEIGKIEFSVQEEQPIGEEVGILLAHDEDRTPPFNKVTYNTKFNDSSFKVDDVNGVITTLIRFDREDLTSSTPDLQVVAVDGYPSSIPGRTSPNTGSAVVQITIEDINDNPPYFANGSYFFTVPENAPISHSVGSIKALDKDDEKTSRYTKYSLGDSRFFGVDENTGKIFVAGILFGQANKNISMRFTADDGKFSASVDVYIGVLKTYNRRPEFNGNYNIKSIVANRSYNESLFQVKANDPDCGNPCNLRYEIMASDPVIFRIFTIDHMTGEVSLLAPLEPRPYVFSVKVTDSSSNRRKKRSLAAKDAYTTVTINPATCNVHQEADEDGRCQCIDYCKNSAPCYNGGTCQLNCSLGSEHGYYCQCPPGFTNWDCSGVVTVTSATIVEDTDDNTWLIVLLVCLAVLLVVIILVVAFLIKRRRNLDKDKSMLAYDNEDFDIREDVVDYDEDGAGEDDYAGYDITMIRKAVTVRDESVPKSMTMSDRPVTSAPSNGHLREFIGDRLEDAEGDSGAPPYDTLHEFMYEGEGSLAGSLSSINTSSSGGDQDYEYLHEWGPKFAKLADMYNTYEDSD
ncbi:neural-cadherin-like isoform X2 [Saccostrea echinata]|uniref:neural-cadherin-like isoform X2 n=1 Tax=Saccostrea echinata TaxID=191078 RepID=UPI002A7EDC21|nr:neural-cadherin-like isoform X2 [Saccostrea echinata]